MFDYNEVRVYVHRLLDGLPQNTDAALQEATLLGESLNDTLTRLPAKQRSVIRFVVFQQFACLCEALSHVTRDLSGGGSS
jgi:DNA-directed RNA polymerase specialized sigma24 family protein